MGWLVNVESRLKNLVLPAYCFEHALHEKKIHNSAGTAVQVIGLNALFSLGTERSKCFSGHSMLEYFAPSTSTWSATVILLS